MNFQDFDVRSENDFINDCFLMDGELNQASSNSYRAPETPRKKSIANKLTKLIRWNSSSDKTVPSIAEDEKQNTSQSSIMIEPMLSRKETDIEDSNAPSPDVENEKKTISSPIVMEFYQYLREAQINLQKQAMDDSDGENNDAVVDGPEEIERLRARTNICYFAVLGEQQYYIFAVQTEKLRDNFVNLIQKDCKERFGETVWNEKTRMMNEVRHVFHRQLLDQFAVPRVKDVSSEEDLPITSTKKTKNGVLSTQSPGVRIWTGVGKNEREKYYADELYWRDFYFVLHGNVLYYYKDSKSTDPTGFIILRYCALSLDPRSLAKGEYRFTIKSPLSTMTCQAKHDVALSEWISCLDNVILQESQLQQGRNSPSRVRAASANNLARLDMKTLSSELNSDGNPPTPQRERSFSGLANTASSLFGFGGRSSVQRSPGSGASLKSFMSNISEGNDDGSPDFPENGPPSVKRQTSLEVLNHIHGLIFDNMTFDTMLTSRSTQYAVKRFLDHEAEKARANSDQKSERGYQLSGWDLDCYLELRAFHASKLTGSVLVEAAARIIQRFMTSKSGRSIVCLPPEIRDDQILADYNNHNVTVDLFVNAEAWLLKRLLIQFEKFKLSSHFDRVHRDVDGSAVHDTREIDQFDSESSQCFILKMKDIRWPHSKVIWLDEKETVLTIGRDKSNALVITDSRVSRSHARVEYSATQCEFIDLGSSCGSKLNGRPVTRARLQNGDVLGLGHSTLIFTLKKKQPAKPATLTRRSSRNPFMWLMRKDSQDPEWVTDSSPQKKPAPSPNKPK